MTDDFVFFGMSGLFGDYADIVHLNGGKVKEVVLNFPADTKAGPKTFQERLDDYNAFLAAQGISHRARFVDLREFEPSGEEGYVIAFRGTQVEPMRAHVTGTLGLKVAPLVHPSAVISPTVRLPEGIIVNKGAVVGSHVVLGDYSLLNSSSYVGHDSRIEAYANIGPCAALASNVTACRGAVVGMAASVNDDLTIGEEAFVGAGAAVIRDVEPRTLVVGVPAEKKKDLSPRPVPAILPGLE